MNLNLLMYLSFSTILCSLFQKPVLLKICIAFIIISSMASCRKDYFVKGSGSSVTNTRSIANFNGINVALGADVKIIEDSVYKLEINAQQNIIDVIETKVKGNTLDIGLKNNTTIRKHNPITITIHLPRINYINISGSGDVECLNNFTTDNLNATVSGSGSVRFNGKVSDYILLNISGSGNIYLSENGIANSAKYIISGSGKIEALDYKVQNIEAKISGSGKMKIHAINTLSGNISGSGNIEYKGSVSPNVKISGSGKLTHLQ